MVFDIHLVINDLRIDCCLFDNSVGMEATLHACTQRLCERFSLKITLYPSVFLDRILAKKK
jgi:hypothetical protein